MIQIIGLRDSVDKSGKLKKRHAFFEQGWGVPTIEDIFNSTEKYLSKIPEADRENLYFTVADCFDGTEARKIKEQWAIPFDIDALGLGDMPPEKISGHCMTVLSVACEALKVDVSKVAATFSGNGLQFFVRIPRPIMDAEYFDTMREHYKVACHYIQRKLEAHKIAGKVDSSVFDATRLMRLPNTWNVKPKHGKKWAFVIQDTLLEQDFDLLKLIGDDEIKRADTMSKEQWKRNLYPPDKETILKECAYLKFCGDNPNKISEEQWYAMLGITSFLPDGDEVSHRLSEGYTGYDAQETQDKVDQARRAAGPRSCKDISKRWDGCRNCAHYNQVAYPISIKGEDFITTATTGFRMVSLDANGRPRPGKLAYEDLIKQLYKEMDYIKIEDNGSYRYVQSAKKWVVISPDRVKNWTRDKVTTGDKPSATEVNEFIARLNTVRVMPKGWLESPNTQYINFNNGVLDKKTKELLPHDAKYGFKYVLPFDYDPRATAPRFEQFLDEVMEGDQEKVRLLKEYGGYILSGDEYKYPGALVLVGGGSNGKSVYLEVLAELCGEDNFGSASIGSLSKNTVAYSALMNKLMNYSEETGLYELKNSQEFKKITSGGRIYVKALYEQEFQYRSNAKIIVTCNEFPYTDDGTHGLARRLLIIRFNRRFTGSEIDRGLKGKLLNEASGIYNLLLSAYEEADAKGELTIPQSSIDAAEEIRSSSDIERAYIEETLEPNADGEVPLDKLYEGYQMYCISMNVQQNHVKPVNHFSRKLRSVYPKVEIIRERREGKRVQYVKGFKYMPLEGGDI